MEKHSLQINKLCIASMFLALGWLMPFISGQIPEVGNMLSPMHIPVMLSGFILGPFYGLVLGFITPLTRCLVFGAPIMYPTAICMAFELATYGALCGFLFRLFTKIKINDIVSLYTSLVISMIGGRLVWGVSRAICGLFPNSSFTFKMFITAGFVNAWPGILLQLLLIPAIIKMLKEARLLDKFITYDVKKDN